MRRPPVTGQNALVDNSGTTEATTAAGPAGLVGRALAAVRTAADPDHRDREHRQLLWKAAADPAALPLGLELAASPDPVDRTAGWVLAGMTADQNEDVRRDAATALLELALREREVQVLAVVPGALERTYDERAVPVLTGLAGHPEADVRLAVASSFTGLLTGLPDGPDVHALLALTRDGDPEVRNWATFTLGFQAEVDSPAIRTALWERTADTYPDAREEGIRGLARRRDRRAVPLLTELLDDPDGVHTHTFDAARFLADPALLPSLLEYEPSTAVTAAVRACDPVQQAADTEAAWELLCAVDRLRPDLAARLSVNRFDTDLLLDTGTARDSSGYTAEALLHRADGDPVRAARLVSDDHPAGPDDSPREA